MSRRAWRTVVVEDDAAVAALHAQLVSAVPGYEVVGIADTAEAAVRLVSRAKPDLVLLDLGLPGRDGTALLRHIRAQNLAMEVIAVTAWRTADVVREVVHLGVVDYLVKPFAPERLRQALGRAAARMTASGAGSLSQDEVDAICASGRPSGRALPRDITKDTLERVRAAMAASADGLPADDLAAAMGLARVTARRYLEYLVTIGEARISVSPGGPGRPPKRYVPVAGQLWSDGSDHIVAPSDRSV
jgi:two-component system response regulator DctR